NPAARSEERPPRARRELIRARAEEPPSSRDVPPPADPPPERKAEASSVDRPARSIPELSFRTLQPDVQARIAAPASDAAQAARRGKLSVEELRVAHEREEDAVANVAAGRVDPLLYDYLRGARIRFQDEAQRIAETIPIGAGQTVRGWGRGLVARVRDAHRNDRTADDVQPDLRDDATKRRPDLAAAYDENRRQAEAGAEIRRVEVCLDVAPGRETTATLRRGSGNAALDRVALEAFARSVSVRPVPPDARAGRACYEVRTATYRAGPAPGIACDLNLGPHGPTCIWPLKKMTSVTSQLLGVEYPAKKSAPANDSLLRSAR
ncbi:MAG TPA: hypothetical protein VIK30_01755, partial [Polyangia bacterium]